MAKRRTYVDACVLISAFQAKDDLAVSALEVLDDPDREFVISDYVRLETVPKPTFHKREEEIRFMEEFFRAATHLVDSSPQLSRRAIELASSYDLETMDALHVSAAVEGKVDELVTLEKPEKPMGRVKEISVKSLRIRASS